MLFPSNTPSIFKFMFMCICTGEDSLRFLYNDDGLCVRYLHPLKNFVFLLVTLSHPLAHALSLALLVSSVFSRAKSTFFHSDYFKNNFDSVFTSTNEA